jgi:hypothetical protein
MPWFEAHPAERRWGWHWTMGRFDPAKVVNGRPELASHYRPAVGPYDSGDLDVLEYHVLLMKLAGIDGVILDWYGPDDHLDYGLIHRSSLKLIPYLKRAGLKFAVCYEDQTVPRLIEGKKIDAAGAVAHGQRVMRWLEDHWFADSAYVRVDGRPLLLVFGPQYYKEEQWTGLLAPLKPPPAFFTLHHRRGPALGGYDWPLPQEGLGLKAVDAFYDRAKAWPASIPVAFPRFHDIYAESGVGKSYGHIPDREGRTYAETLERALRSRPAAVQIATWNDWGEGTAIEPSAEFGTRDLEKTQDLRRRLLEPGFRYREKDLLIPRRLFTLRREHPEARAKLDRAAGLLYEGKTRQAAGVLEAIR